MINYAHLFIILFSSCIPSYFVIFTIGWPHKNQQLAVVKLRGLGASQLRISC